MGAKMRLDKFLAESGQGTRSEVKGFVKKGMVSVNGKVVKDSSLKVDAGEDEILLGGRKVNYEKFRYFMLNKPQGCVSATRDGLSATVIDLLAGEITRDLFPVGRLDKDTEGFLLITNDGQLGHELLSPKKHVDKTYLAAVTKALSEDEMATFAEGVDIGDEKKTMPAKIELIEMNEEFTEPAQVGFDENAVAGEADFDEAGAEPDWVAAYEVVLQEGRYHQVKRMFEAFGSKVIYLKRVSMGDVELDESLEPGEYRRLTEEEVQLLRRGKEE